MYLFCCLGTVVLARLTAVRCARSFIKTFEERKPDPDRDSALVQVFTCSYWSTCWLLVALVLLMECSFSKGLA